MTTPTTGAPATFVFGPGNNVFIDAFTGGPFFGTIKWGGGLGVGVTVDYSFPAATVNPAAWSPDPNFGYGTAASTPFYEPWFGYHGLDATQQTAVTNALDAWSHVANIQFNLVPDNASQVGDIRVAFTSGGFMEPGVYAYTYLPYPNAPFAGDMWINTVQPVSTGNDYSLGANGWATVLHELGHALGLNHPFDGPVFIPDGFDSMQYSIMSYSDYDPLGASNHFDSGFSSYYPTTPMLYDILALQYLYGPNLTWHAGDDVYVFSAGQNYYQTLWDAGGTDTIVYVSAGDGAVINLNAGQFSELGNTLVHSDGTLQDKNVAIAFNVTLENVIGGDGSDTIIGNAAANILDGGAGNDALTGGAGNDTFVVSETGDTVFEQAGGGTDVVFAGVSYTLGANLEQLTLTGAAIAGTGNDLANIIVGNGAANVLTGGAGFDLLVGGAGDDTYLIGDADTIIEAGGGGHDTEIAFTKVTLAAEVEDLVLRSSAFQGSGNALDNEITGNRSPNRLTGGDGNDSIDGGRGDDRLDGADGNDLLEGGAGHDLLIGGAGDDIFFFGSADRASSDTIQDFQTGVDIIGLDAAVFTDVGLVSYDDSSGALFYDGAQLAVLAGAPAFSETDIALL